MNYARIALASLGALVAYFVYGFAMFAAWPSMKTEFMKYPNVYRPKDEMMKIMPYGMVATLSWCRTILQVTCQTLLAAGSIKMREVLVASTLLKGYPNVPGFL
jgi:hypothetical protein